MNGPWTGSPAVWTDVPAVWGQLGDGVPGVEVPATPAAAALAVRPATASAATASVCGRAAMSATARPGQPTLQAGPQATAASLRLGAGPAVVFISDPQSTEVTAACGAARAVLAGPDGVAAPTVGPTGRTALAAVAAWPGLSVSQTTATGHAPVLGVLPGRVGGQAVEIGQVGGVGLGLGLRPVLATVAVAVTAAGLVLVAAVGAALAGTGLREVLRLASPLLRSIRQRSPFVRSVRRESPLCRRQRLGSAVAIERR